MSIETKWVMRDCLETLRHQTMIYQAGAAECDSDGLRKAMQNIMNDKDELRNAVFNLMHQRGECDDEPAEKDKLAQKRSQWQRTATAMQQQRQAQASAREDAAHTRG
jgi:hypothetical protein